MKYLILLFITLHYLIYSQVPYVSSPLYIDGT